MSTAPPSPESRGNGWETAENSMTICLRGKRSKRGKTSRKRCLFTGVKLARQEVIHHYFGGT